MPKDAQIEQYGYTGKKKERKSTWKSIPEVKTFLEGWLCMFPSYIQTNTVRKNNHITKWKKDLAIENIIWSNFIIIVNIIKWNETDFFSSWLI